MGMEMGMVMKQIVTRCFVLLHRKTDCDDDNGR